MRPDCAQVASRLHPGCVRATRAREHYVILGIDKTGENCSMKWRNWAVEHSVEHNVPRSFCNVPRTFVEQSEIVNALIHIVEHPWNTAQRNVIKCAIGLRAFTIFVIC